jgi:TRAP-type C4-dicarboxylate transport system substrate-binding protein
MLKDEFERAMVDLTSDLRTQAEESVNLIQKSGVEIIPIPTEPDLKNFYNVGDQVAQRLAGSVYPKDLLDRVYEILKRIGELFHLILLFSSDEDQ